MSSTILKLLHRVKALYIELDDYIDKIQYKETSGIIKKRIFTRYREEAIKSAFVVFDDLIELGVIGVKINNISKHSQTGGTSILLTYLTPESLVRVYNDKLKSILMRARDIKYIDGYVIGDKSYPVGDKKKLLKENLELIFTTLLSKKEHKKELEEFKTHVDFKTFIPYKIKRASNRSEEVDNCQHNKMTFDDMIEYGYLDKDKNSCRICNEQDVCCDHELLQDKDLSSAIIKYGYIPTRERYSVVCTSCGGKICDINYKTEEESSYVKMSQSYNSLGGNYDVFYNSANLFVYYKGIYESISDSEFQKFLSSDKLRTIVLTLMAEIDKDITLGGTVKDLYKVFISQFTCAYLCYLLYVKHSDKLTLQENKVKLTEVYFVENNSIFRYSKVLGNPYFDMKKIKSELNSYFKSYNTEVIVDFINLVSEFPLFSKELEEELKLLEGGKDIIVIPKQRNVRTMSFIRDYENYPALKVKTVQVKYPKDKIQKISREDTKFTLEYHDMKNTIMSIVRSVSKNMFLQIDWTRHIKECMESIKEHKNNEVIKLIKLYAAGKYEDVSELVETNEEEVESEPESEEELDKDDEEIKYDFLNDVPSDAEVDETD